MCMLKVVDGSGNQSPGSCVCHMCVCACLCVCVCVCVCVCERERERERERKRESVCVLKDFAGFASDSPCSCVCHMCVFVCVGE